MFTCPSVVLLLRKKEGEARPFIPLPPYLCLIPCDPAGWPSVIGTEDRPEDGKKMGGNKDAARRRVPESETEKSVFICVHLWFGSFEKREGESPTIYPSLVAAQAALGPSVVLILEQKEGESPISIPGG